MSFYRPLAGMMESVPGWKLKNLGYPFPGPSQLQFFEYLSQPLQFPYLLEVEVWTRANGKAPPSL